MIFSSVRCIGLVFLCLMLAGCGNDKGPKLANLEGTVTLNGKPLQGVTVVVLPSVGRPASGITDAAGHYETRFTRDKMGAPVGAHRIRVEMNLPPVEGWDEMEDEERAAVLRDQQDNHPIPKDWRTGQPITVESGSNVFDISMSGPVGE